jgi:hypothetical protein
MTYPSLQQALAQTRRDDLLGDLAHAPGRFELAARRRERRALRRAELRRRLTRSAGRRGAPAPAETVADPC